MDDYGFGDAEVAQPSRVHSHSNHDTNSTPPSAGSTLGPRLVKRKYRPRASQACERCRIKKAKVVLRQLKNVSEELKYSSAIRVGRARFAEVYPSFPFGFRTIGY